MSERGDISDFKEEDEDGKKNKIDDIISSKKNIPVKTHMHRMEADLSKLQKDLEENKKLGNMLKGELISLEGKIKEKCNELSKCIIDDLSNFKKDLNRAIVNDKTETDFFKTQTNSLNEDKIKLQKESISLQSRMSACEVDIGVESK